MIREQHDLVQGSPEWHAFRREYGGASEVAALFDCNPWYPNSPQELYWVKSGQKPVQFNRAMQHGNDHEEAARGWACDHYGILLEPEVWSLPEHRISASLDGKDGGDLCEVKAPPRGRASPAWAFVEQNCTPPAHYLWQCQQQLLVTGADVCHFVVYDPDEPARCDVLPDPSAFDRILQAWADYHAAVKRGDFPDLECEDAELLELAAALADAQAAADEATARANALKAKAKQRLSALDLTRARFGGWQAFQTTRTTLDRKAAEKAGIDLAAYEKTSAPSWTLKPIKNKEAA